MDTRLTDGQLMATLKLLEQKGVTTDRYQALLASGILADILEFPIESQMRFDPNYANWVRNLIRVPLGLHVKGLKVKVRHGSPITELVERNHYHKVRYKTTECKPADVIVAPVSEWVQEVTFDTIDAEDWKDYETMEADLRHRKLRIATPRELVCFDGEYPFVANYILLCVYTRLVMATVDSPLRVSVATNQKPGLERALSFYPRCLPDRLSGQWVLVVPLE